MEDSMEFSQSAVDFPAVGAAKTSSGLGAGSRVEAKFGGKGRWYPGKIDTVNADGTFAILFDDGDKAPSTKPEDVRPVAAPIEPTGSASGRTVPTRRNFLAHRVRESGLTNL